MRYDPRNIENWSDSCFIFLDVQHISARVFAADVVSVWASPAQDVSQKTVICLCTVCRIRMWCPTVWMKLRQPRFNLKFHELFQHSAKKTRLKFAEIQVQLKHWKPTELGTQGYPMGSCWCWVQWMDTVWNYPQGPSIEKFLPIEIESVVSVVTPIHWTDWVCAVCQVHLSCHAVDTVICQLHQLHIYCTTLPHLRFANHESVKTSPNSCCVENPRSVGARTR